MLPALWHHNVYFALIGSKNQAWLTLKQKISDQANFQRFPCERGPRKKILCVSKQHPTR